MIVRLNESLLAAAALLLLSTVSVDAARLHPDEWTPEAILVDWNSPGPSEAYASISVAEGTPWCDGRPTFWMVSVVFVQFM